jgi:uncharacterized protein YfiM (DUF2279 family)
MSDRDEYVQKLKVQLDLWNGQLTAWQAAAREATAEAKVEMEKQVGIVRSRLDDMAFRMEQLRGASAEAWQEIARGADEARKAMQDAFEKARSRIKDV